MAKKVLFLIPRDSITLEERHYYMGLYPEVEFASADPYNPMKIAKEKLREGIEIIAGRGNTAVEIRREMADIHVVEIPITGYDIIQSLGHTDFRGKTIAVITNNADIIGLSVFEQLYGFRILSYIMVPFHHLPETIRDAVAKGADFIVGGAITCKVAQGLSVPNRMIYLGKESMARSMHEIRQVQEAIEIEAQRMGFINHLIDNIAEGVISVDLQNRITLVNANAERVLQIRQSQVAGELLPVALQHAGIEPALLEGADEAGSLIEVGKTQLMATRIPIMSRAKNYGTIYTLHEVQRIALMEHSIRKAVYDGNNHQARYQFSDLIGKSARITESLLVGKSYARTDANILITGETGTGKELFAQSIHNASARSRGAFVAVNCAALPTELLESELFGYVEGAFTGATRKGKAGLFETAHGGTVFLDEISEMSYQSQGSLLRVIQEKYVVRLGSLKILPVDVRIIAATNRDLRKLVEEGRFREDLFYRLSVLNLAVPPLRERSGDAELLLLHFLHSAQSAVTYRLDAGASALLSSYHWSGNVREVANLADRIKATASGPALTRRLLEALLGMKVEVPPTSAKGQKQSYRAEEAKRAIEAAGGDLGRAAEQLGINRSTLWRRLKRAQSSH